MKKKSRKTSKAEAVSLQTEAKPIAWNYKLSRPIPTKRQEIDFVANLKSSERVYTELLLREPQGIGGANWDGIVYDEYKEDGWVTKLLLKVFKKQIERIVRERLNRSNSW